MSQESKPNHLIDTRFRIYGIPKPSAQRKIVIDKLKEIATAENFKPFRKGITPIALSGLCQLKNATTRRILRELSIAGIAVKITVKKGHNVYRIKEDHK